MTDFRRAIPFEKRRAIAANFVQRHPDKVPIVFEGCGLETAITFQNNRVLIPRSFKVSDLMNLVRNRAEKDPKFSVYISAECSGKLKMLQSQQHVGSVYERYKQDDEVLYLAANHEETFG